MKKLELRDYQKQIVNELKHFPASALFMGTGTGKTYTSLELIKYFNTDNLLVITPHNALGQWKKFINQQYSYYNVIDFPKSWSSKRINEFLKTVDWSGRNAFVINYDMVFRLPRLLSIVNRNWTIILDEMHRIRNFGMVSKPNITTDFILKLGELTEFKVGLTATPTQGLYGGYLEFYTQLKFLGYTDETYKSFYDRHVIWQNKSIANLPFPLKEIIGYRDTKSIDNVLKQVARRYVPTYEDYEPQFIEVVVEKPRSYNKTMRERAYKDIVINNASRSRIAKKTLTTGTIHGNTLLGKVAYYKDNDIKLKWLQDFIEDSDMPVIVMYNYNVELNSLIEMAEKMGIKYGVINGAVKDKNAVVEQEWKVLFGQYQATSEALDGLQYVTNLMVLFAMPESSISYRQVIGRIDRIGQTKPPTYYTLIMEGTIDEAIQENINNKIEFSEETLNKLEV